MLLEDVWYYSVFMSVFGIVSEPRPWAERQPHTLMVFGCFTVSMKQDQWTKVHTFSCPDKLFFQMPQTTGKGIYQTKGLYQSSAVQSVYLLQDISLTLMLFLERSCFFALQAILQKSLPHFACRCSHTCLLAFRTKFCTGGAPIPQLNQL